MLCSPLAGQRPVGTENSGGKYVGPTGLLKESPMRRGSISIYLSLTMLVMTALLAAVFYSVRAQAGRMQLANSVDQALFSTFAQYDRDLLENFDVFFIDGSCGTDSLRPLVLSDRITDSMQYILHPTRGTLTLGKNLLHLSLGESCLTGYTLATDVNGQIFVSSAIEYMKETIGAQGITQLLSQVSENASRTKAQETRGKSLEESSSNVSYEEIKAEAETARTENEALIAQGDSAARDAATAAETAAREYGNPLPAMERLRQMSFMELVLGDTSDISQKSIAGAGLLCDRPVESGIGVIDMPDNTQGTYSKVLYNEYILTHFGNYAAPSGTAGLSYQTEYILEGRDSDAANLEAIIKKLLLAREAVNIIYLCSDPARQAEIDACAAGVASMLLIPVAAPAIGALITAGWAFCESIVDVRALLGGKKIALVKSAETWQVDLRAIPGIIAPDILGEMSGDVPSGVSYSDYLRFFLFFTDMSNSIPRSLAMVESTIRGLGRPNFRLDTCIFALTFDTSVVSEHKKTFTMSQTMSYKDFYND